MSGPAIANSIAAMMERSSWIRRMFEEGTRLKAAIGAENVFDFTLGNPVGEPPEKARRLLAQLAADPAPGTHRYMPNAGLPQVREHVARHLAGETGLPFNAGHVVMTCGAGGALNVIIKSLCDPGDEVIILAPYFAEYLFYIANHRAAPVIVDTDERFQPVVEKVAAAITPRTRILLINSPNNPTGAVYPEGVLRALGEVLDAASARHGRPVYMVMDEPYRKLVYEGVTAPSVFPLYRRAIIATSHSKDLNLPGERIGYLAIHPHTEDAAAVFDAMTLSNRILGFVNAPALFQRLVAELQDEAADMTLYARNRDTLVEGLAKAGYEAVSPGGGFYLFPRAPIADDVAFVQTLKARNILVVPGSGFGRPGHFRIAFCCDHDVCARALPGFAAARRETVGGL